MKLFLWSLLSFALFSCTSSKSEESVQLFECEQQNQGEACWKLGNARSGAEALEFYRRGCAQQSTKACLSVAEKTQDRAEAQRVLKQACGWKNTTACDKVKEFEGTVQ